MSKSEASVLLRTESGWIRPIGLRKIVRADSLDQVVPVLAAAEKSANDGLFAAGFVSYEAAPAFDPALVTRPPGSLPLAWFAIFDGAEPFVVPPPDAISEHANATEKNDGWRTDLSEATHATSVATIHAAIARGETYQVNFTFPLSAPYSGSASELFRRLDASQRGGCAAFFETDDFVLCSASPELFFELEGNVITCRPMKGTAPRGRSNMDDDESVAELAASIKNRAENLMIVDMVRNDLGRIAETGTVKTARLFDIERYPNVLQMTSTIDARTTASVTDIFHALFPSASITGAPKVQTAKIISEIEASPRGVYCGAIGFIAPNRKARFSVAIRTVQLDKKSNTATFGTGSGIVWDSVASSEYAECLTKASILDAEPPPEFQLLETLRRDTSSDWKFLNEHFARLAASARYFGFAYDDTHIRESLEAGAPASDRPAIRARLLLSRTGEVTVETAPMKLPGNFGDRPTPNIPFVSATIANVTVNSKDVFLFHKTTHREVYSRAKASCPGVEEVLLVNERDELTEGTIGNIVLQIGDDFLTPVLDCGLLPGIFREFLLARGVIREALLSPHDIHRANAAYLINSVRGWSRLAMRA